MCLATGKLRLNSIGVQKSLFNFFKQDVAFGMIGTEVPPVGGIPDDRPIVHLV
jgi:hypothetical protein